MIAADAARRLAEIAATQRVLAIEAESLAAIITGHAPAHRQKPDRLITSGEAMRISGHKYDWLHRNCLKHGFGRQLETGGYVYSERGLLEFLKGEGQKT